MTVIFPVELVNCQVLLKGCETSGYVILSAAKAHILQREHKPVWKHGTIVPKTTWVGALEGMQYYATVSAGSTDAAEGKSGLKLWSFHSFPYSCR